MNKLQSLPEEQLRIRANCVHPTGKFFEFKPEEVEQSIVTRFEQQVQHFPDRIAIKTRRHQLSYAVFNQLANQIAQALLDFQDKHDQSERPIALLLEHDAPLIAAIMGILKAGKIYLPLDPTYPDERLSYILQDTGAAVIITNNQNLKLAQALAQKKRTLLNLDALLSNATGSQENPALSIKPNSLAYILYTSGSTGTPKGVMQAHRNVLFEVRNYTNALHICPEDRLLLISSCSFADSVRTIFSALLNGATLCPFNVKAEGFAELVEWLIAEEVTIYRSVPTAFRHFCSLLSGNETFPQLRAIYMAGEPVYRIHFELYKKHFASHCIFVNGLGASECLSYAWYFMDKNTSVDNYTVPAGYSPEGKISVVLDENQQAVAPGQIGEIVVESLYLSPGYWKKPELTQAHFFVKQGQPSQRLYFTGDLGYKRPDGCLVHVGRQDFQVKIRGHRIELAEIEAALLGYPAIKEAVVIATEAEEGLTDRRLVAYLVLAKEPVPNLSELQHFLSKKLPDYMIPAALVPLKALPLTPNGKLDRRALPSPEFTRSSLSQAYTPPANPIEEKLADIWAKILRLDAKQIGTRDKFLELGGDSLLAGRVQTQIEEEFGTHIPISVFFDKSTIEELAQLLSTPNWVPAYSSLVPVQPHGSKKPLFWVFPPAACFKLAKYLGSDQPVYGLRVEEVIKERNFSVTMEEIAQRFIQEIKTVQPHGPYFIIGHSAGGSAAFEMAQQLQAQGKEIALLALVDTHLQRPYGETLSEKTLSYYLRRIAFYWRQGNLKKHLSVRIQNFYKYYTANPKKLLLNRQTPPEEQKISDALRSATFGYNPRPGSAKITLFFATELFTYYTQNAEASCRPFAPAGLDAHAIPGDHITILEEPNFSIFSRQFKECLDRAHQEIQSSVTDKLHA